MQQELMHWSLHKDEKNIVWLTFNKQQSSVNNMDLMVLAELESVLNSIKKQGSQLAGLVIQSGKESGFIAGADIEQFRQIKDLNEAFEVIRRGQKVFQQIEDLSIPTVALISGFCLGGGLELAVACRYRITEDLPGTRLGVPEIKLGIHPGWGGSIRLVRLLGPIHALDLMLSGRSLHAKQAKKMGLVDEVLPQRQLQRAVEHYILNKPEAKQPGSLARMANLKPCRYLLNYFLTKKVERMASKDNYPAPFAVLQNWLRDGGQGEQAYIHEANSVAKLLLTDTAQNLVRVFFLQEQLKRLGNRDDFTGQHIHVIGAGTMGADIAAWCVVQGFTVSLQDKSQQAMAAGRARAVKLFQKRFKKNYLKMQALDRLILDEAGDGIAKADLIIEAIVENLEIKQNLFAELEKKAKPSAILATNTSTIPLDEISEKLQQPERLVGIHFFNPVAAMPLVEIVKGANTSEEIISQSLAFVRAIDRLPLPVKSSPGFLVNRVLLPYLMEAMQMVNEGMPLAAIDKAAKDFGMPMGPIELADRVGLDVCLSAAKVLTSHLDAGEVPPLLIEKVDAGMLGKKSGQGFYLYKKGKLQTQKTKGNSKLHQDIALRLIARMLNEAGLCLHDGIVESEDFLDAGMIFGTGFAPFRGGLMHYAKTQGGDKLVESFDELSEQYGERFAAAAYWKQQAENARKPVMVYPNGD